MGSKIIQLAVLVAIALPGVLLAGCSHPDYQGKAGVQASPKNTVKTSSEVAKMENLRISSPEFNDGGMIPKEYTCDGEDINPALRIEGVPPQAKSLALIVDDPDAPMGTWVHWVVWNIPQETREINKNSVPEGAVEGINDFKKHSYGGPCPPSGTHRYFFKLYALDTELELPPSTTKKGLEEAMEGHIIDSAKIIGLYRRS